MVFGWVMVLLHLLIFLLTEPTLQLDFKVRLSSRKPTILARVQVRKVSVDLLHRS